MCTSSSRRWSIRARRFNLGLTRLPIPVFGEVSIYADLARVSQTLSLLLRRGRGHRARVGERRSHLTHVAIALRTYYNDQGAYPPDIEALYRTEFITDPSLLVCSCVAPDPLDGERPHSYQHSCVAPHRGGELVEVGR